MKSILVVEDNLEVRENLCEILELAGYNVHAAEHGSAGVELAITEKPDLILCDVMMPRLDGYGVLKILRTNKLTSQIPFIFLTAKVDKQDFRKGMGLGADDYITKPFDDTDLLEAIEIRLNRRDKNEQAYSESTNTSQKNAISDWINQRMNEGQLRTFNPKDIIYQEGSYSKYLYYVVSGLVRDVCSSDDGKQLIVDLYGQGDFFGTSDLVQQVEHKSETSAVSTTELCMIPKQEFIQTLGSNRIISKYFLFSMSKQVEFRQEQLFNQAYNSVRKKVADALILFHQYTRSSDVIDASRDDLAMLAGVAKETLIRTLSAFKSENLISIQNKELKILDKSALQLLKQ